MRRYNTLALAFVLLAPIIPAYAQDQETQPTIVEESRRKEPEERESRAVRSFYDTVAWNARNHFGFTLGVSEGRSSNVFPSSIESHPSMITSFSSGIFANFGRRKSQLHLDYGAGYRIYNQQHDMNGADHYGNISYSYQANRKLSFQLSDTVSSSLNDPFSSFSPTLKAASDWTPSPTYAVLFLPQRLTQNQARGQIDFDLTRSTHFSVYGIHDSYRYSRQEFNDIDAVQVGAGLNQRITKWLFLLSTYSTYLNNVDERLRDYQIHQLEIGRFRFMLSRNCELFASGGIEMADARGDYRTEGMFRAGISRSSKRNILYANYQRMMTSALGYARILRSDLATLGIGQRLTTRIDLRLSGSYMRSTDFDYAGFLRGYSGRAQFEYALRSDLSASMNYTYQYQNSSINILSDIPHFSRSMVFVSLQYTWPSIRLLSE